MLKALLKFIMELFGVLKSPEKEAPEVLIEKPKTIKKQNIGGTTMQHDLKGKKIVIDPGHGLFYHHKYKYIYQRQYCFNLVEDELNMRVATKVVERLEDLGAEVICTRYPHIDSKVGKSGQQLWKEGSVVLFDDKAPVHFVGKDDFGNPDFRKQDINSRWQLVNFWHMQKPVDFCISIHHNALNGRVRGTETWYQSKSHKCYKASKWMGESLLKKTVDTIKSRKRYANCVDKARVKYGILTRPDCPSVIWEGCFFDNKATCTLMSMTYLRFIYRLFLI